MADHVTDESVLHHIQSLVAKEQALYETGNLDDDAQRRLQRMQVELDQCWDLLRQRRALREFGKDPDQAAIRPESVVERYEQ